jgi:type II secretory pathway component PulF
MPDAPKPPRLAVTAVLAGLSVLAWLAPAAVLAVAVPIYKKRFDEFGIKLPAATQWTWSVSGGWAILAALQFAILAAVAGYFVRHQVRSGAVRALWWLFAFALPLLLLLLTAGPVLLAEMKLQEGLRK